MADFGHLFKLEMEKFQHQYNLKMDQFNLKMEEYCESLPEDDQRILRKYFVVVGMTHREIRATRIGAAKSEQELFMEALKKHCGDLPERRFKKVFNILNKAHLFCEPLLKQMFGRNHVSFQNDEFVHGSKCHYKKEYLLKRISNKPMDFTFNNSTVQDTLGACKLITPVDFERLKQMKIIELEPEKIHTNKCIKATLIDDGFKLTAYHTVIEDIHGQCAKLCIYHITPLLLKSLKKGVKIALANPHYKLGDLDEHYFIRMESPEEVIVMQEKKQGSILDQVYKSSEDYRIEGNKFFTSAQYSEAIACYTCAIDREASNPVYVGNRAQCYLKLKLYEEALLDSEAAVKLDPNTDKHQFRLAMAWSGLGDHEKSCEILKNLDAENYNVKYALAEERKLLANNKGEFDFTLIEKLSKEGKDLEIGDYIGPITIDISSTHGHGVYATRDIKKREPIVICRALAFSRDNNEIDSNFFIEHVTMGKSSKKNTRELIDSVTAKVTQSKLTAFQVFNLALKHQHQEPIPIELYTSKGFEYVREKSKPPYQIEHIRKIVQDNQLGPLPDSPCGFWPILSYFNHSCLPNSAPKLFGDICVIRACTDIPKGVEVYSSFFSVFSKASLEERKAALLGHWDYVCSCEMCRFESDPKNKNLLERGIQLMNRAKKISSPEYNQSGMIQQSHFKLLNEVFTVAKEMNLGRTRFNSSIWRAIHYLTNIKIDLKDHGQYYDALMQARPFLCEYDLEHELLYWIKCNGFVKMYRANVPEEFKIVSELNLHLVEILMKPIDDMRFKLAWSNTYK